MKKPQPGHRLQVDFLERIPGSRKRLYQFTAIDDCTRIRVLKIFDACNQDTAIRFIDDVFRRLPFRVHVVQTDNGAEFLGNYANFPWQVRKDPAAAEALDERALEANPSLANAPRIYARFLARLQRILTRGR